MFTFTYALHFPWLIPLVIVEAIVFSKIYTFFPRTLNFKNWSVRDKLFTGLFLWIVLSGISLFFNNYPLAGISGVILLLIIAYTMLVTTQNIYLYFKSFFGQVPNHSYTQAINEIDLMTGHEFEEFLHKLLNFKDFDCTLTSKSGDYGVDLILQQGKRKIAVQAKRYGENNKVGVSVVNEIVGGAGYWGCNEKWIITNSYFTEPAVICAHRNKVKLIDREELCLMLKEYSKSLNNRTNKASWFSRRKSM